MAIQSKHYLPELHYMRGPGPRWHKKNAAPATPPSDRPPSDPKFALPHELGNRGREHRAATALALA